MQVPTYTVGSVGPYVTMVQFAQFSWMFEIPTGNTQKGEIRFGSAAEEHEGFVPVKPVNYYSSLCAMKYCTCLQVL